MRQKLMKRAASVVLAICMLCAMLPNGATAATIVDSGNCGEGSNWADVTWTLDSDGVLTISGTGAIAGLAEEFEIESHLVEIESPPWVENITNIKSVTIGDGITSIGELVFFGCSNLTSVTIPDSVTFIGYNAFIGCNSLTSVTIPASVTSIGNNVFSSCESLTDIEVVDENSDYCDVNGVLFDKGKSTLIGYPAGKTDQSYIIPNSVTSIGSSAFSGCSSLASVTIPNSVTSIGVSAFAGCSNLTSVTIPDSVTTIDYGAFSGCSSLTSVTIPDSVTSIGNFAFSGCSSLTSVAIPDSVTFLGDSYWLSVFQACTSLTYVVIPENITFIGPAMFAGCNSLTDVYYGGTEAQWSEISISVSNEPLINATIHYNSTGPDNDVPATPTPTPTPENSKITKLYPTNGATAFPFDDSTADTRPRIFFDREVASTAGRAQLDFSKGTLEIRKSENDELIYSVKETTLSTGDSGVSNDVNLWMVDGQSTAVRLENVTTVLDYGTEYYVTMPAGFIKFADGTVSPAIEKGEWQFTTDTVKFFSTEATVIMKASDDVSRVPISVKWDDGWFMNSAEKTYNHELARTAMALSGAAYVEDYNGSLSPEFVQSALRQFKFDEIKSYNYSYPLTADDNDHVAYTLAVKKIKYSSNDTTYLVAIVVKGTSSNEEWYSNFNIGTNNTHEGFYLAKAELMNELEKYLSDLGLTADFKNSTKFLVTGHSRGAAVANLVAAELSYSSHAVAENVYGYTFASPTVSTEANQSGYENIFNIISGEDFITQVPLSQWGFKRYGIDLLLPSRSYFNSLDYDSVYAKMSNQYYSIVSEEFESFNGTQAVDSLKRNIYQLAPSVSAFYNDKHDISGTLLLKTTTTNDYFQILADVLVNGLDVSSGTKLLLSSNQSEFAGVTWFFVDNHVLDRRVFSAHSMAGYYSWLSSCDAEELFGAINKKTYSTFKRLTIACPVDVYIYNNHGEVVASIVNDEIVSNELTVSVIDSVKTIDLPNNEEYSIEIVATDNGSVSYTVEELSAEGIGDSVLRTVEFKDIKIIDGDKLTGKIDDVTYTSNENYVLTKNNTSKIYANYDSYDASSEPIESTDPTASATAFIDVQPGAYYYDAVQWAVEKGITNGYGTTDVYAPDVAVDRGQMAVYLWRLAGEPNPTTTENPFKDVDETAYYYDAVLWAVEKGITNGYGTSDVYAPNVTVDRSQMAVYLWRMYGQPSTTVKNPFTDVNTKEWYSDAVLWCVAKGITNGTNAEGTTYSPTGTVDRGQMAVYLYRADGN